MMPDNATGEESDPRDSPSPPALDLRLRDLDHDLKQVNETLQTLRQALELKERGGLGEAEYQELKKRLLAQSGLKLSPIVSSTTTTIAVPEITEQAVRQATIGLYAGELHQLIVQQIEENYRQAEGQTRECMRSLVAKLHELHALYPQDKPYLHNLIDVVCNKPETLEYGLRQLDAINEEVRNNISTSDVAKALTGIAYRSAKHAVASLESQKRKDPQTADKTLWDAVEVDVLGGLAGATTTASIAAVPGFSLAALGFVAAASVPITWVPAVGALIGAGVNSGWKYARARFVKNDIAKEG
jgi:hypothetical protein